VTPPYLGLEPVAFSSDGEHLLANLTAPGTSEAWVIDLGAKHPVARSLTQPGVATSGNAISRNGRTILLTDGYSSPSTDNFASQAVATVPWGGGAATILANRSAFASWNR
jgi:Tol biopolymer transport system component